MGMLNLQAEGQGQVTESKRKMDSSGSIGRGATLLMARNRDKDQGREPMENKHLSRLRS